MNNDENTDELHPPDESRETGPGELLSRKREALGMSVQDVADELHITMHYVRSLEENAFDKLPGDVFVRGYIRAYASLLKLDPQVLVNVFNAYTDKQGVEHEICVTQARRRRDKNLPWIIVSGVAFVAIAVGLWYFNSSSTPAPTPTPGSATGQTARPNTGTTSVIQNANAGARFPATAPTTTTPATTAPTTATPVITGSASAVSPSVVPAPVDAAASIISTPAAATSADFASGGAATTQPNAAAAQSTDAVPATDRTSLLPVTEPVRDSSPASAIPAQTAPAQTTPVQTLPTQTSPTPSAPAQTTPVQSAPTPSVPTQSAPAQSSPTPAVTPQQPVAEPSVDDVARVINVDAGGQDVVQITFGGNSLVQVDDRSDKQIYSDVQEAGDVVLINGSAPFNILLGDASTTELRLNGSRVDFSSSIRLDNSARLTIGL
ncbi:MAG: RodZ domain-containing protein [Pseudomonadota bacterium]